MSENETIVVDQNRIKVARTARLTLEPLFPFIPLRECSLSESKIFIGRKATNPEDLVYDSLVMSRKHAAIWIEGEDLLIQDCGSSAGTFVNGKRLLPMNVESTPHKLKNRDQIQFGISAENPDSDKHKAVVVQVRLSAQTNSQKLEPQKRERRILVEFNGSKEVLTAPVDSVDSVDSLTNTIKKSLSIRGSILLNVFEPNFQEYVLLKSAAELPENAKVRVILQAEKFWNFDSSGWTQQGALGNTFSSLVVKDSSGIHSPTLLDKFSTLLQAMEIDPNLPTKIVAICNSKLVTMFENNRDLLHGKHRANPPMFMKTDWNELDNLNQREFLIKRFEQFVQKFPQWNGPKGTEYGPPIIPMIQGTKEEAVWNICQQGFGFVGTTDKGYYGQGIYFTRSLDYAWNYSIFSPVEKAKVFLLSLILPGNPFPITEDPYIQDQGEWIPNPLGYLGKPCRPGYQSHITVVESKNLQEAFPARSPEFNVKQHADELVVFEVAQALPLFVFYCS